MGYKDICSNVMLPATLFPNLLVCALVYASGETGMMAHLQECTVTYMNTYVHAEHWDGARYPAQGICDSDNSITILITCPIRHPSDG